jgi:putative DNA primase/helicase
LVTDTPDDKSPSEAVKEAMGKKRPVKGSFTVIDGGKGDAAEAERLKRPRKSKPEVKADADDERPAPSPEAYDEGEAPSEDRDPVELEGARHCAAYDQNDRDNARRLIYWFGMDLAYVPGMGWVVFRTTHWVRDDAELEVALRAQTVVDMIKLEALVLEHSPGAIKLLAAAKALETKPQSDWSSADHKLARSAENAEKALSERKSKRRAFAITSGNRGRTVAMVAQAASMKAVDPKVLDANHMKFNVLNGTLTFSRIFDPEREEGSDRLAGHIEFVDHPDRADMITKVADVVYDPDATCPEFTKFLTTVQPDPVMRQFLQVGHA